MPKGIPGTTKVGNFTVDYYEIKENDGGGPRGLNVTLKGHEKSKYDFYPISPNPHDNTSYNKDQANFYAEAAKFVVGGFSSDPADITGGPANLPQNPTPKEMDGIIGSDIGKKLTSKKKWLDLKKEEQKTFLTAYKKAVDEWKAKAEKVQAAKDWTTHLKAMGNKSFTWKSVSYKLPAPTAAT